MAYGSPPSRGRRMRIRAAVAFLFLLVGTLAYAQVAPAPRVAAIPPAQEILAPNGMVVAQESRAARIGVTILDRGGNAVDAAVAVGFALAVTYPRAGNIGGGGFMVIHLAKANRDTTIDYRETAPAAASAGMFLDPQGNPDPKKSRDSGLAVGVPGAGHPAGAGGLPGRGRFRRFAPASARPAGALALVGGNLPQRRRAAQRRR